MFRRLDSFAKKISESTKTSKSSSRSSKSTSSSSSASTTAHTEDGAAHIDQEDLDMNLLIGPNKGKTAAQIIDELDVRYFSEEFDPLEEILSAFPAHQSQASDDLLEAKLNELDVVKLCIDKRLSNQVFANYHHFGPTAHTPLLTPKPSHTSPLFYHHHRPHSLLCWLCDRCVRSMRVSP